MQYHTQMDTSTDSDNVYPFSNVLIMSQENSTENLSTSSMDPLAGILNKLQPIEENQNCNVKRKKSKASERN